MRSKYSSGVMVLKGELEKKRGFWSFQRFFSYPGGMGLLCGEGGPASPPSA